MEIILGSVGRITTHFGEDIGRGFPHRGIDQGHGNATPRELEIHAPARGKVTAVGRDGTYGNRIIIDLGSDEDDNHWTWLGAHAESFRVSVGDWVDTDQHIGKMGNTGTIYVHLHQELRRNGVVVDPLLYLRKDDEMALTEAQLEERFAQLRKRSEDGRDAAQRAVQILEGLEWTKHGSVDAPADVVDADTLTASQDVLTRVVALEETVNKIARALNVA